MRVLSKTERTECAVAVRCQHVAVCCREHFDAKLQIEVLAEFMTEQAQTQFLKVSP